MTAQHATYIAVLAGLTAGMTLWLLQLLADWWDERQSTETEDAAEDPERTVGGWLPDLPRNHYVGGDGEPHPIDEDAEKVNS